MDQPMKINPLRHSGWFSRQKKSQPRPARHAHPGRDTAVGEKTFGKAYVNCGLRGNNSKWGKLQDKDAAVLQLVIDPRQEQGFKLRELILELSFAEADPRLQPSAPSPGTPGAATVSAATPAPAPAPALATVEPSLIILEPPSPNYLKGKTVTQHNSYELLVQPQVGAGGISIGGMGPRVTKDKDVERSWRFHSHWANNELGVYTDAQWVWNAVAENPDIEDVGALFAGVVIQHPGQPFYLTCRVSGKLVGFGKKFRYGNEDDSPYYTIIHPKSSQQSIRKEAEELEKEIIRLIKGAAARVLISEDSSNPRPEVSSS